jgi:hypothetical protein
VLGIVHVHERLDAGSRRTLLLEGVEGQQDRLLGVVEDVVPALDLDDVGVAGDRPERHVALRFHAVDRIAPP